MYEVLIGSGLLSVREIVTTYIPGSVALDFGLTIKFGNNPDMKISAPPKLILTLYVSSGASGSYIDPN